MDEKGHRLPLRDRANFRVLSSSAPAVRGIVAALNFAPILSGVFARTKKARSHEYYSTAMPQSMNFGAVMLLILFILATRVWGVSRDDLIRHYFELGYTNLLISCFLYAVHGIVVSVSTVKRSLRKQHLRRRGLHRNLRLVAERVLVSLSVTCVLKC